jgi:hypothetical protein
VPVRGREQEGTPIDANLLTWRENSLEEATRAKLAKGPSVVFRLPLG